MQTIIAQTLGIVAMFFNIFSYQQKKAKHIIAFQLFGTLFFSVSYLLLGAYIGAILNFVGFIRAIVYLQKDKLHTNHIGWLLGFCAVYVAAYVMTFAIFGQEATFSNFVIECLPVVGMVSTNLAYRYNNAKYIRRFGLVSSVSWLIYNIIAVAVGAILCEVFSIVSIFVAIIRLERNKECK